MKYLLLLALAFNLSCSVNVLENFANPDTDEALYVDAVKLMNRADYTGALAKIDKMTAGYSTGRPVVMLRAQANAGLCGLNFFDFVLAFRDLGSTRILPFLLSHFRGGANAARLDYCVTSENLIRSLGAVGARSLDENLLMLMVNFAKIGNILSFYADVDQDGTATPAYNVCTIGSAGSRVAGAAMPDEDARQVGTGLTLAKENLGAIAGQIDLGTGSLGSFDTVCASPVLALAGVADFCNKTQAADFTANELLAIRSIVHEGSAVGLDINGCAGGDISSGACRCF